MNCRENPESCIGFTPDIRNGRQSRVLRRAKIPAESGGFRDAQLAGGFLRLRRPVLRRPRSGEVPVRRAASRGDGDRRRSARISDTPDRIADEIAPLPFPIGSIGAILSPVGVSTIVPDHRPGRDAFERVRAPHAFIPSPGPAMTTDPHTTPAFRTNNFDLLRLLAASQVLFFHARAHLDLHYAAWTDAFWYFRGVPVFFVISGYLISASWERGAGNATYVENRLLRILPGLWTCIVITVAVATLFGFDFLHPGAVVWFFAQLVGIIYTPAFLADFGFGSYNGSLWTIPVELQFYFILPLFYLAAERMRLSIDAVLVAAFVFFSIVGFAIMVFFPDMLTPQETRAAKLLRYCFFTNFYVFLAGVLLQRFAVYRSRLIAGRGLYWTAVYAGLVWLSPAGPVGEYALMLVLAVTVVSLAYTLPDLAHRLLRGNDISYGVYIYHGLLIDILVEMKATGSTGHLLAVAIGTYAAATVSWFVVERSFLRRKKSTLYAA